MAGRNGVRTQNAAAEFTLPQGEIERLIGAAGSLRNRVLVELLAFTGLRREEAVNLDVEDLDLQRKRLVVREGKGGKSRVVPFSDRWAADVKGMLGKRQKGPLFLSTHGKGQRLNVRSVNHVVATAGKRAGLTNPNLTRKWKGINPHLLRHSFARYYLSQGGDLRKLSQILGHASVAITHAVYGTASDEEVNTEYARIMGGVFLSAPEPPQAPSPVQETTAAEEGTARRRPATRKAAPPAPRGEASDSRLTMEAFQRDVMGRG
jgi:integrase